MAANINGTRNSPLAAIQSAFGSMRRMVTSCWGNNRPSTRTRQWLEEQRQQTSRHPPSPNPQFATNLPARNPLQPPEGRSKKTASSQLSSQPQASSSAGPSSSDTNPNAGKIDPPTITICGKSIIIPKITIDRPQLISGHQTIKRLIAANLYYAEKHPDKDHQRQKKKINILKNKQAIFAIQERYGMFPAEISIHNLRNVPEADIKATPKFPPNVLWFQNYIDWNNSSEKHIEWHKNTLTINPKTGQPLKVLKVTLAKTKYGDDTVGSSDSKNQSSSSANALTSICQRALNGSPLDLKLKNFLDNKPMPLVIDGLPADMKIAQSKKRENLDSDDQPKLKRLKNPAFVTELVVTAEELELRGRDTRYTAAYLFQAFYKAFMGARALYGGCIIETDLLNCEAFNNHPYVFIGAQLLAAQAAGVFLRFKGVKKDEVLAPVCDHLQIKIDQNSTCSYEKLLASLVVWSKDNPQ